LLYAKFSNYIKRDGSNIEADLAVRAPGGQVARTGKRPEVICYYGFTPTALHVLACGVCSNFHVGARFISVLVLVDGTKKKKKKTITVTDSPSLRI
jgi:hypothetical protein